MEVQNTGGIIRSSVLIQVQTCAVSTARSPDCKVHVLFWNLSFFSTDSKKMELYKMKNRELV
jgi:hypothetical protein